MGAGFTAGRNAARNYHISLLKKYFPLAKKVLCVGARHDSEVESFLDHGYHAIGIDRENPRASDTHKIQVLDANHMNKSFKENSFDIVYASHVLSDLENLQNILKNIRFVAQSGCFIVMRLYDKDGNNDPTIDLNHIKVKEKLVDISDGFENMTNLDLWAQVCQGSDFTSNLSPTTKLDRLFQELGGKVIHLAKVKEVILHSTPTRYEKEVIVIFSWKD